MTGPEIVVRISAEGVRSVEIQADSEQEQVAAEELLERIRPCLDVADTILKKTSAGPRG